MSEAWSSYAPRLQKRNADRPIIGRRPIILASIPVVGSLFIAGFASLTGIGVVKLPDAATVHSRDFTFIEQPDGRVEIRTAVSGEMVQSLSLRDGGGFIQAVIKGMTLDRVSKKVDPTTPYRLSRHADGRLILHDPATGRRQTVDTFGPVNAEAFAKLLSKGEKQ
jgi:putative photosynthetic complex assembly protein